MNGDSNNFCEDGPHRRGKDGRHEDCGPYLDCEDDEGGAKFERVRIVESAHQKTPD
ncbi:hypothetical protein B0T18DRAFT_421416 [Schizothecium vesticola]|uniref:Uncharacterized protein n=1 Tax=Schizothecium vesticola TaxID=314040 RepID=A0AA40BPR9_9PEZI|nr:hypothetical protein B0T18DRAFT_421416 [Schizothecium vesticola]